MFGAICSWKCIKEKKQSRKKNKGIKYSNTCISAQHQYVNWATGYWLMKSIWSACSLHAHLFSLPDQYKPLKYGLGYCGKKTLHPINTRLTINDQHHYSLSTINSFIKVIQYWHPIAALANTNCILMIENME